MEKVTNTTNINITISRTCWKNGEPGYMKALLSVSRCIRVDGKAVYKDKMDPMVYMASFDSIKELEEFLLGLEKSESGNDIGSNGAKLVETVIAKPDYEKALTCVEERNRRICEDMLNNQFKK